VVEINPGAFLANGEDNPSCRDNGEDNPSRKPGQQRGHRDRQGDRTQAGAHHDASREAKNGDWIWIEAPQPPHSPTEILPIVQACGGCRACGAFY
jgi:hypothetical protein